MVNAVVHINVEVRANVHTDNAFSVAKRLSWVRVVLWNGFLTNAVTDKIALANSSNPTLIDYEQQNLCGGVRISRD
jgi:hypothetical protein